MGPEQAAADALNVGDRVTVTGTLTPMPSGCSSKSAVQAIRVSRTKGAR